MRRERAADLDHDLKSSPASSLQLKTSDPAAHRFSNPFMKASNSASAIGTRCLSSRKAAFLDVGPELLEGGYALALRAWLRRTAPPANESVARNALSCAKVSR